MSVLYCSGMNIQSLVSGFLGFLMTMSAWLGFAQPSHAIQVPLVPIESATSSSEAATSSTTGQSDNETTSASSSVSSTTPTETAASSSTADASTYPLGSAWLTALPVGDYKYVTSAPKKGYIYLCNVMNGGQGAQATGSWIHGSVWDPAGKTIVEGSVSWPNAKYSMKISGGIRLITSNGLPTDRTTGTFPIGVNDPAYQIDRNPNTITAQSLSFSLPASPAAASSPGCIFGQVGIMNNGVELFDAFDNENRDAIAHEEQDSDQGHPDESGTYHYHGFSDSLKNLHVSTVVGFAFDGFPITGPLLPSGNYLTTSDLDVCHGMTSTIALDGKSVISYHYVLTEDFPYSISCFHGTSTFKPTPPSGNQQAQGPQQGSQPQGGPNGTPPAPPQAAINACTGKSTGAACTVSGGPSGTCTTIGTFFACKPQ